MPVNEKQTSGEVLQQRVQYQKGGVGRLYWDYRDRVTLSFLEERDQSILDLGCGEGITLERMRERMPKRNIIGIDCMRENINICLRHGLPARIGNVYDLEMDDESIDAVLLMEVIEHLEKPHLALEQIRRILRPRGKVIIVFPNDRIFKIARVSTLKFREASYDPGHVKQWTHLEIENLLLQHGFSVVHRKSIPFFLWPISLHGVTTARKIS